MEKPCRRRKIEFIEDSKARNVSFVKRRGGLFRKASELAILCGAHCAVVTFSERGTPFVFGHPSADAVIDRFLGGGTDCDRDMEDWILSEAVGRGVEPWKKKRKLNCNNNGECSRRRFWWDDEELIDGMEKVEELELYTSQVRELRKKVRRRMEEMIMVGTPDDLYVDDDVDDDQTLQRENNVSSTDLFSPGDEDHEDDESCPETIRSSSSSLMVSSSSLSSCCVGSSSSGDDDINNVYECLDELVAPKSVASVSSSSAGGDFWQMLMMMMEGDQQEKMS